MVEMSETSRILHRATSRSLVIIDELGRGTGTWDGVAIAWAVMERLHAVNRCRTLAATHYKELAAMVGQLAYAHTCRMAYCMDTQKDRIVYAYSVEDGVADRSYGIEVAKLKEVRTFSDQPPLPPLCIPVGLNTKSLPSVDPLGRPLPPLPSLTSKTWLIRSPETQSQRADSLAPIGRAGSDDDTVQSATAEQNEPNLPITVHPVIAESDLLTRSTNPATAQQYPSQVRDVLCEVASSDVSRLTPLDALTLVHRWQSALRSR